MHTDYPHISHTPLIHDTQRTHMLNTPSCTGDSHMGWHRSPHVHTHMYIKPHSPSTSEVSRVTLAALRRPAGRLSPIFSSRSRRHRPPFLDLALDMQRERETDTHCEDKSKTHTLRDPDRVSLPPPSPPRVWVCLWGRFQPIPTS